jgi:cyclohexyl-isocyanide hydratase
MPTLRIGLLLFDRMTQLDMTGPFEVFTRVPDAQVLLVAKTLEPIEADTGLRMLPYTTLRDCAPLDVVCVPGGPGVNALMEDEEVLAWLRE